MRAIAVSAKSPGRILGAREIDHVRQPAGGPDDATHAGTDLVRHDASQRPSRPSDHHHQAENRKQYVANRIGTSTARVTVDQ
jgi:hypothetical protein